MRTEDAVTTAGATGIAPGTGTSREDELIAEAMLEAVAAETGGETDMTESVSSAVEEGTSLTHAEKTSDSSPSVKDRLKQHTHFWAHTLRAPHYIQSIIDNGYAIEFTPTPPPPCYAPNNQSAMRHRDFVDQEIMNCVRKGYVIECQSMPHACNPLTVAEGKKLRLVLDLRNVNPYVRKHHHRYDDLDTVTDLIEENDHFTIFDLVSAYYHINVHPNYHKYLGFQWTFKDGRTRYFVYVVLVFGLSTAGYVFTKVLRPLVTHWRLEGLRIIFYLDDGLNIGNSYTNCANSTATVLNCLQSAGFLVNVEKSQLEPKQSGEWLGFEIDTRKMMYSVPQKKVDKLKVRLSEVCTHRTASARLLSSMSGTLSSMRRALGPIVALMTRNIYFDINFRLDWDTFAPISESCHDDLIFWKNNINTHNGYAIKPLHPTSQIIFTDASEHSYGGYILQRLGNVICQSRFTEGEKATSSTNRELVAIKCCLE